MITDPDKEPGDDPAITENGDANPSPDPPSLNNHNGENVAIQMEYENGIPESGEEDRHSVSADHVVLDISDSPPAGYEEAYIKDVEIEDEGIDVPGEADQSALGINTSVCEEDSNISFGGNCLRQAEKDSEVVMEDRFDSKKSGGIQKDASYEEIEKNRKIVREELEKMGKIEEEQLKKFEQLNKLNIGNSMFPDVRVSSHHTVAFRLRDNYDPTDSTVEPLAPFPTSFSFTCDSDFVLMPCSIENEQTQRKGKLQTWQQIKRTLASPICSCSELNERINSITNSKTKFNVLQYAIEEVMTDDEGYEFFANVLPFIVKLCLDLPNLVTAPIPLLQRGRNYSISLTQKQIASLLANAFFSTFPKRSVKNESYPSVNLDELFSCEPNYDGMSAMIHKVRCILHYFERMAAKDELHNGIITFTRKSMKPANSPDWNSSTKTLKELICLSNGTIETEGTGLLQVDFANKSIGGGVLGRGAVQEEILFVIYPELLISRLFTENLNPGEAFLFTGCERFSKHQGYSTSFSYTGDFFDCTEFDNKGRRLTQIVAIDALYIRKALTQFNPRLMMRELNKAYAAFSIPERYHLAAIASGKWGCGAFNGNPELKIILQLLAASEAGRDLVVFTFGDTKLQQSIVDLFKVLKDKTILNIWILLKQYYTLFCTSIDNDKKSPKYSLFQFLMEYLTVGEIDMRDSKFTEDESPTEVTVGEIEMKDSKYTEDASPTGEIEETEVIVLTEEEKENSTGSQSEEAEFVPNSPDVSEEDEDVEIIEVIEISDEVDSISVEKSKTPTTPTKELTKPSKERPLSDLYSKPMRTPTKITISITTDENISLASQSEPTMESNIKGPQISSSSSNVDEVSVEEAVTNTACGTEEIIEQDISSPPRKLEVKKIVTDEDYQAVFSHGASPRSLRIAKHPTSKRKLSMSPPQSESGSAHVRKKQSSGSSSVEVIEID